jgi:transposase-like protein
MKKTYERGEQAELIRAVTRGRESVRAAAARLGVPLSTAYGWARAARGDGSLSSQAEAASPTFLELVPATARATRLVVRVDAVEIEVGAGFDAALLRAVIAAVSA